MGFEMPQVMTKKEFILHGLISCSQIKLKFFAYE